MPYITKNDLKTHAYDDIIDVITRSDDDIVTEAIAVGIDQAKAYLMRFDLLKLFGNDTTEPVVKDANLKSKVKALAIWQLIMLANPNIDMKVARTNYEDAIAFLKDVMKSQQGPDGWPLKSDDSSTDYPEGHTVTATYNSKKNQRW